MNADEVYAGLADGTTTSVPPEMVRQLSDKARRSVLDVDVEVRLGAARVGSALPAPHGIATILALVRDPDVRVRRRVLNGALAARAEGLPVIRRMVADSDAGLSVAALELLAAAGDAPAASSARELVRDPRPGVRAAAAALAGMAGGPGLTVDLRKIADDPDPSVRAAVELALERLAGKAPRPTVGSWWERDAPKDAAATADTAPQRTETPALAAAAPPEPAGPDGLDLFTPLPPALPTDPAFLVPLLGGVAAADRARVVEVLKSSPAADLQAIVTRWRPGGDPATGRGIALAIAALDRQAWFTRLQAMAGDRSPAVRAAAAEAIGQAGGLATIPWATALLKDLDPRVVAAAARAVGALGARLQRPSVVKQWLTSLKDDKRPGVAQAAADALAGNA